MRVTAFSRVLLAIVIAFAVASLQTSGASANWINEEWQREVKASSEESMMIRLIRLLARMTSQQKKSQKGSANALKRLEKSQKGTANALKRLEKSQDRLMTLVKQLVQQKTACVQKSKQKESESRRKVPEAVIVCPEPWTGLDGKTCVLSTTKQTVWSEAAAVCRTLGGRLFAFQDEQEVEAVKEFANRTLAKHAKLWVGHYYKGQREFSTDGPTSYNPPRSLYWMYNKHYRHKCAVVDYEGDLRTVSCSWDEFALCRKPLSPGSRVVKSQLQTFAT